MHNETFTSVSSLAYYTHDHFQTTTSATTVDLPLALVSSILKSYNNNYNSNNTITTTSSNTNINDVSEEESLEDINIDSVFIVGAINGSITQYNENGGGGSSSSAGNGGGIRNFNHFFKIFSPWLIATSIINLIGNVTILCLIKFSPTFRKPANYLICNLSAASLFYMVTLTARRLEKFDTIWLYGPITCRILPVLLKIPSSVISLTLMAISSDRSKIIRNPFDTTPRQDSTMRKILYIWCLSIIIVLPYGIAKKFDPARPEHYKCIKVNLWGNPLYNVLYGITALLVIHIIPAFFLLFDVTRMLQTMKFLSLWPKQVWKNKDRRVTLMCNVIIYTCVFIFCWLPIGITRFPLDLPPGIIDPETRKHIQKHWESLKIVSYICVSVHPILLFLLSHDLRRKVTLCFV